MTPLLKERERCLTASHLLIFIWLSVQVYESAVYMLLVFNCGEYRGFVGDQERILSSVKDLTDLVVWCGMVFLLSKTVFNTWRLRNVIVLGNNDNQTNGL